jgi:hypothetical protein
MEARGGVIAIEQRLGDARFTIDDAKRACDEWGANCGPGAIAAVCGLTLDELRPHMGDFECKGYTNPTLMREILGRLPVRCLWQYLRNPTEGYQYGDRGTLLFPRYGLARIQWEGPWTAPGVPMRVRYRHSHWVGSRVTHEVEIFDINCMCVGGWVPLVEWSHNVVPWLLGQCQPKANGRWHLTHSVEVSVP